MLWPDGISHRPIHPGGDAATIAANHTVRLFALHFSEEKKTGE